jgi:hypothetical protein
MDEPKTIWEKDRIQMNSSKKLDKTYRMDMDQH